MEFIFSKIFDVLNELKTKFFDILGKFLTPFTFLFGIFYNVTKWVSTAIETLKAKVASGVSLYDALMSQVGANLYQALPPSLGNAFAFVNYALPLTELFVVGTLLVGLMIVCAVIRFIKGFIPTIS